MSPASLLPLAVFSIVPLAAQSSAQAQEPAAERDWRALLVDDETVALLEVDLDSLKPSAVLRWAFEQPDGEQPEAAARPPERDLGPVVAMADGVVGTLRSAGARSVFATASARNVITGGAVAIPCEQTDVVANLLELAAAQLPPEAGYRVRTAPGIVVLGSDRTWARLQERMRDGAAELPERFTATAGDGELPHRLTVSLPAKLRGELAAIWPASLMPDAPIELAPNRLAADVRALSLRLRLPPEEPALELRLATEDEAARERVAGTVRRVADQLDLAEVRIENVDLDDRVVVVQWEPRALRDRLRRLILAARGQRAEAQAANQLKQIGLAMHNYADNDDHLPPRMAVDPEGRPLYSWRVFLLPYLEQPALHDRFRLGQPWDSPENRPLSEATPVPFRRAGEELPPGHTRFRLPQIEGSLWHGDGPPRSFRDVTDGTSHTIAAAVAPPDQSVRWAAPEPWELDPDDLISSFFGDAESTWVLFLDGSVQRLPRTIGPETLKAFLTHAGGEVVERP